MTGEICLVETAKIINCKLGIGHFFCFDFNSSSQLIDWFPISLAFTMLFGKRAPLMDEAKKVMGENKSEWTSFHSGVDMCFP